MFRVKLIVSLIYESNTSNINFAITSFEINILVETLLQESFVKPTYKTFIKPVKICLACISKQKQQINK